jgi:hypothetical protein
MGPPNCSARIAGPPRLRGPRRVAPSSRGRCGAAGATARALAIRPFLLLLEELLSLLDHNTRLSLQAEAARTLRARLIVSSVNSESAQFSDTLSLHCCAHNLGSGTSASAN